MQRQPANSDPYIIVGKIASPYGVQGWLKIISFTEIAESIFEYKPWYLQNQEDWQLIEVEQSRKHGKGVIVKFAGLNSPEQAQQLTGKMIGIARSQLPALKKGDYYWSDLEGLTVINQHGDILGKVIYLISTGANDVLIVEKGNKQEAIPYLLKKVVLDIDLESQTMLVNWEMI